MTFHRTLSILNPIIAMLSLQFSPHSAAASAGSETQAVVRTTSADVWRNPLVLQRADPHVFLHSDGYYYFTGSVPEYDRIVLRRAKTLDELRDAPESVIWRKHADGDMGAHIWAPEIHRIDGKWYIYFAAGHSKHIWNIRMYVLENASENPLEGEWVEKGRIETGWDSFSLDATTFEHRGTRYLVWAQHDPKIGGNTCLYIAPMDTPWSIVGEPVRISRPEFDWECVGFKVNEGASVLIRNGRIFMTYSASATNANYCVGLLTADADSDLLDPRSWHKSPTPVLATDRDAGVFGPGHNSFTTTPDGLTDVIVYHARNYENIKGDPLYDPNRHARAQIVRWTEDGTPLFMPPTPDDVLP